MSADFARRSDPCAQARFCHLRGFPDGRRRRVERLILLVARSAVHAELSAELFNTANRANFNNPNVTQSGSGFGSITSATDPRIGQLALKLLF
jgi:hypothetical protein